MIDLHKWLSYPDFKITLTNAKYIPKRSQRIKNKRRRKQK